MVKSEAELNGSRCAALGGFSLHANTACGPQDRDRLEQLCRYVARPAIAMDRLFQRPDGLLVYKLKKPYNDGTEYLLFSPEELLEKLAALVPIPRAHLEQGQVLTRGNFNDARPNVNHVKT